MGSKLLSKSSGLNLIAFYVKLITKHREKQEMTKEQILESEMEFNGITRKFGASANRQGRVRVRLRQDYGRIMARLWQDCGRIVVGLWQNYGRIMVGLGYDRV